VWIRVIGALLAALSGFLVALSRAVRQLFHEAAGALFLAFSIVGAAGAWREWQRGSPGWIIGVAAGFAAMMAWFAVASFRSARRVGK
jgi:hypothetical protein